MILVEVLSSYKTKLEDATNHLIAELQIAFVQFLLCETLSAFDQWKKLVILLCTSEKAIMGQMDGVSSAINHYDGTSKEIGRQYEVALQ